MTRRTQTPYVNICATHVEIYMTPNDSSDFSIYISNISYDTFTMNYVIYLCDKTYVRFLQRKIENSLSIGQALKY